MQAILFDLDGTLLPMDMGIFTAGYFRLLVKKAAPRGYAPKELIDGIWSGTRAMVQNDGTMPNRERFWRTFAACFGERAYEDEALFDDFYANEFHEAVRCTTPAPEKARLAVMAARATAEKVILATNPIFPLLGVVTRLKWIGLTPSDFDHVTTYENASYCKPNPRYYQEILAVCGLRSEACMMVGNDVDEDIRPAAACGMETLLVKDCMVNKTGGDFSGTTTTLDALAETLTQR